MITSSSGTSTVVVATLRKHH